MKTLRVAFTGLVAVALTAVGGCSQTQSAGAPAAAAKFDGTTFEANGFKLTRPSSWSFVPADNSVAPDTLVVMQGPPGNDELAPSVEVSRRNLSAMDQRRKPVHILTTLAAEISQTFDSYETTLAPEEVSIAGKAGARLFVRFTEQLPDGKSVDRLARFYGVVNGGSIWVVRCMGPTDDSAASEFDSVIGSAEFDE